MAQLEQPFVVLSLSTLVEDYMSGYSFQSLSPLICKNRQFPLCLACAGFCRLFEVQILQMHQVMLQWMLLIFVCVKQLSSKFSELSHIAELPKTGPRWFKYPGTCSTPVMFRKTFFPSTFFPITFNLHPDLLWDPETRWFWLSILAWSFASYHCR